MHHFVQKGTGGKKRNVSDIEKAGSNPDIKKRRLSKTSKPSKMKIAEADKDVSAVFDGIQSDDVAISFKQEIFTPSSTAPSPNASDCLSTPTKRDAAVSPTPINNIHSEEAAALPTPIDNIHNEDGVISAQQEIVTSSSTIPSTTTVDIIVLPTPSSQEVCVSPTPSELKEMLDVLAPLGKKELMECHAELQIMKENPNMPADPIY